MPIHIGQHHDRTYHTQVVRAGQRHRAPGDRSLTGLEDPVVVQVVIDITAKARRLQFSKIIVVAINSRSQRNVDELVVARNSAARGSLRVFPV